MKDYSVPVEICHVLDSNGIKELSFLHVKHLQFYELKNSSQLLILVYWSS